MHKSRWRVLKHTVRNGLPPTPDPLMLISRWMLYSVRRELCCDVCVVAVNRDDCWKVTRRTVFGPSRLSLDNLTAVVSLADAALIQELLGHPGPQAGKKKGVET